MLDLALTFGPALVCGALGLPLARLLAAETFRWRVLAAPALGLSVLAVAVNGAYRLGASPGATLAAAAAVTVAIVAVEVRRAIRAGAGAWDRGLAVAVIAWAAAALVMLAPRWVGGDQFSVFQANQWDTYGYLESALVYAREPYETVARAGDAVFRRDALVMTASGNLQCRPAVHLLYGAFSRVAPAEAYRLYYPFLVFLVAQAMLVGAALLRAWLPRAGAGAILAASAAFPLGFWGQYVLDINAWSQMASIGPALLLLGLLVEAAALAPEPSQGAARKRLAGAIGVAVAGVTFLYPENLIYHLAVLVPLAGAATLVRARRTGALSVAPFLPFAGLAGVLAGLLHFEATLRFGAYQAMGGSTSRVPWWRHFQAFFAGRDGGVPGVGDLAGVADAVAAVFGLYFATPSAAAGPALALLQRVGVLAAAAVLVAGVVRVARGSPASDAPGDGARLALAALAAGALLLPAAGLALRESYWSAGKALSYASPALVLMLAAPAAAAAGGTAGALRWVVAAFVAFQLALGLARIDGARSPSGIHYARPYPSVEAPELKEVLRWDVRPLEPMLGGVRRVVLAPMNSWTLHHLLTFLYARGVETYYLGPLYRNFGAGDEVPPVDPGWQPDALVGLSNDGLVVRYADGRPDGLVPWRQVR